MLGHAVAPELLKEEALPKTKLNSETHSLVLALRAPACGTGGVPAGSTPGRTGVKQPLTTASRLPRKAIGKLAAWPPQEPPLAGHQVS